MEPAGERSVRNIMFDHPVLLTILAVVNIPLYIILMGMFFGDIGGLFEAIRYWCIPDIISAFRGEFIDDQWSELKLGIYVALCILTVVAEYTAICKYFF
jgi:hypothetical protein